MSLRHLGPTEPHGESLGSCRCCQVPSVVSDPVRPHRRQPTRLRRPWDSPGKNTGVGCPFLLQCIKVKSESEVAQPCPNLRDLMDCGLPGSSIHGIFQARVLEWGAIAFSTLGKRQTQNLLCRPNSSSSTEYSLKRNFYYKEKINTVLLTKSSSFV